MTKKKVSDSLQISILSLHTYVESYEVPIKKERIVYVCEELDFIVVAKVLKPTEEYFDDANIVFVRDTLIHFLGR